MNPLPGKLPFYARVSLVLTIFLNACHSPGETTNMISLEQMEAQYTLLDQNVQELIEEDPGGDGIVPQTINEDGSMSVVAGNNWTSGFFPGTLWYMYELTGKEIWKERAIRYTEALEDQMYNAGDHDVGFRMYCSYGNALRLSGNIDYIPVLVQSARTLSSRYYRSVGSIRSWDFNTGQWQCPVIVDNMMNLELLFWATEQTGDPVYRDMAIRHAETTMQNHYRPDYSSYHVVDYDTISGEVRKKNTHQGYSDESSWARGQAWGLYGFTMTYRFTRDPRFLNHAEKIAGFLLDHPRLPEDLVPYWDFDAPGIPDEERDVSAAAIICSALYELSVYSDQGAIYREKADRILETLGTRYTSGPGENFGFILDHSVGNKPGGREVDVPLIYADYYFVEAWLRRLKY